MSRTKMILAAMGGISLLGVLAMAYLVWTAVQRKGELDDELSGAVATVESLSRAKVYPSKASILAVASNVTRVAEWKDEVFRLVSAGDRVYEKTTAPAFKNFMVSEAKRLAALPGEADGKIAKAAFTFGPFKDYIFEGKMPSEQSLGDLQRKWDDVVFIIETLGGAGISEITDIQAKAVEMPKEEETGKKRNARKRRMKAKKAEDADAKKLPVVNAWTVAFETRPAGYVKTLNAFALSERFAVVEDVTVTRKADAVVAALGGEEKKEENVRQSGRRRRRAGSLAEPKDGDDAARLKDGVVTDPSLDEPLKVFMTVKVYDFRTLEAEEKEIADDGAAGKDSKKKGASK